MGEPGSTNWKSWFLTSKPTPFSRGSSSPLPSQKHVYSLSLSLPETARRVSYSTAISTLSPSSSPPNMAVLRMLSVFRMSLVSPVSIVRTFQFPNVRVGRPGPNRA